MKKLVLSALLGLLVGSSYGQQEEKSATEDAPSSYGKFSLNYLSNSVYNGRKDSLNTPYLTPTLGYYDKSGFFVEGALSYLTRTGSSRIDLFALQAGYDFSLNNLDVEITANKSFYNSNSTNVKSEIKGGVNAALAYDFGFIRPTLQGGLNFGTSTDYLASFGLEHSFKLADDHLEILPSFLMNASSQNYYGNYYGKRKYAKLRKKNGIGLYYDITADLSDASRFKLLDYEFSLPLNYNVDKFTFSFIPSVAIPTNPAAVTVNIKATAGSNTVSKTFTEKVSNSFFWAFQVDYKF